MSNQKLHKAIRKNQISLIGINGLLTDELFGIVGLHIDNNGLICTTIYNQLNYSSEIEFKSHHERHGTFFYNNQKKTNVCIMLDSTKTVGIDIKHDNLRKALKNY